MNNPTDPHRSATMRAVRSKDTGPELLVRSLIHRLGYRFRLHCRDLPGVPDIVFPGPRKVIFVHGCFWHGHDCARGCRKPKANREYWSAKIERNKRRDAASLWALAWQGRQTLVVWECETRNTQALTRKLVDFLDLHKTA